MHYSCPLCKAKNEIDVNFHIEEYVCKACSNLISVTKNTSIKVVKKPIENVVLEVGQIGFIENIKYTVVAIIVRKYGTHIFWREYFLKDQKGNDAFLSESEGHWVFLVSVGQAFKDFKHYADFEGKKYRWYETTLCSIHSVTGFFDDKLDFRLATYREYVNGTEMISSETSGSSTQYFKGKHISKNVIKKAFLINDLPNYYGVGIVQPFYVNIKQAINILCIAALLICLIQAYVYSTRTNDTVFKETIQFKDVSNKELISKSFTFSGGSAPLQVKVHTGVDNSWANVQLSLVNESTSESVYISKDIEKYSGYEGGESWSEGSENEEFNICGVAPGKYHFVISAEKQGGVESTKVASYLSPDGNVLLSKDAFGIINVVNNTTKTSVSFGDTKTLKNDKTETGKLVHKTFGKQNLDSLLSLNAYDAAFTNLVSEANSVDIIAIWLPVSFWNFWLIIILMVIFFVLCYVGNYYFNVSKWKNSSNSPYPQS